jgi:hypothetical protein
LYFENGPFGGWMRGEAETMARRAPAPCTERFGGSPRKGKGVSREGGERSWSVSQRESPMVFASVTDERAGVGVGGYTKLQALAGRRRTILGDCTGANSAGGSSR